MATSDINAPVGPGNTKSEHSVFSGFMAVRMARASSVSGTLCSRPHAVGRDHPNLGLLVSLTPTLADA